jgi:hypothetical protein
VEQDGLEAVEEEVDGISNQGSLGKLISERLIGKDAIRKNMVRNWRLTGSVVFLGGEPISSGIWTIYVREPQTGYGNHKRVMGHKLTAMCSSTFSEEKKKKKKKTQP